MSNEQRLSTDPNARLATILNGGYGTFNDDQFSLQYQTQSPLHHPVSSHPMHHQTPVSQQEHAQWFHYHPSAMPGPLNNPRRPPPMDGGMVSQAEQHLIPQPPPERMNEWGSHRAVASGPPQRLSGVPYTTTATTTRPQETNSVSISRPISTPTQVHADARPQHARPTNTARAQTPSQNSPAISSNRIPTAPDIGTFIIHPPSVRPTHGSASSGPSGRPRSQAPNWTPHQIHQFQHAAAPLRSKSPSPSVNASVPRIAGTKRKLETKTAAEVVDGDFGQAKRPRPSSRPTATTTPRLSAPSLAKDGGTQYLGPQPSSRPIHSSPLVRFASPASVTSTAFAASPQVYETSSHPTPTDDTPSPPELTEGRSRAVTGDRQSMPCPSTALKYVWDAIDNPVIPVRASDWDEAAFENAMKRPQTTPMVPVDSNERLAFWYAAQFARDRLEKGEFHRMSRQQLMEWLGIVRRREQANIQAVKEDTQRIDRRLQHWFPV